MKLDNYYWVYQIECIPTGKRYIGLTGKPNPCWRWSDHYIELRNGISKARLLQEEWNRHPDFCQWSFRGLVRVEGIKAGRLAEAKAFLEVPEHLRLNSPLTLAVNFERHDKIVEMLKQKISYRQIVKATGVSLGLVSKIKAQLSQADRSLRG